MFKILVCYKNLAQRKCLYQYYGSNYISTAEGIASLDVLKVYLVENYNDKWIIDSKTTNHVCYSLEWFKQSRPLSKGQRSLKFGKGVYVSVMAVGLVKLCF